MANDFVRSMLVERRKRLVSSIMSYAETTLYRRMTMEERKAFREKVLGAVDSYHDVCLDLLKASVNDGSVVNEEALRVLGKINGELQAGLKRAGLHP